MIKLSVSETNWFPSQDRCCYSLYFDFNILFRARKARGVGGGALHNETDGDARGGALHNETDGDARRLA